MEDREMADQRIHTFIIRTKKERKNESKKAYGIVLLWTRSPQVDMQTHLPKDHTRFYDHFANNPLQ